MEPDDDAAQLGTDDDEKIVGVGIVFVDGADGLVVESLVPGSGAAACGDVLVGDEILTIQGKDVSGQPAAAIAKLVAGPVGTTVMLTVRRRPNGAIATTSKDDDEHGAWEIKVLEIPRVDFPIDEEHFVPWTKTAAPEAKSSLFQGAGRLLSGVGGAAIQNSVMMQMKNLQTSVQKNSLFENISSHATMVRQSATSAVLPVLKNANQIMQLSSRAAADPRPKDYVMHLYTHPDKYVVMPPSLPAARAGEPPRRALVIERASIETRFVPVEEAEEMTRGKAKIEIFGVLGIATLLHSSYLLIVTGRRCVGHFPHGPVFRVTSTGIRVLGSTSKSGLNQNPLDLSNRAIEFKVRWSSVCMCIACKRHTCVQACVHACIPPYPPIYIGAGGSPRHLHHVFQPRLRHHTYAPTPGSTRRPPLPPPPPCNGPRR